MKKEKKFQWFYHCYSNYYTNVDKIEKYLLIKRIYELNEKPFASERLVIIKNRGIYTILYKFRINFFYRLGWNNKLWY